MSKNSRYLIIVLIIIAICGCSIFYIVKKNGENNTTESQPVATITPTIEPTEEPKVMLPELVDYYNKNQADEKFVSFSLEIIRGGNAASTKLI